MTDDNPHPVGRAVLESLSAAKEEGRATERVRIRDEVRYLWEANPTAEVDDLLPHVLDIIEGSTDA